jgi:hypothetical protein
MTFHGRQRGLAGRFRPTVVCMPGYICDSMCGRCGSIHAFSSVTRFVGLPSVLAVDFGACLPSLGKRRALRCEPVHAPLQISVSLGRDGLRAGYELASFVELKDSHRIAYVRARPCRYDPRSASVVITFWDYAIETDSRQNPPASRSPGGCETSRSPPSKHESASPPGGAVAILGVPA